MTKGFNTLGYEASGKYKDGSQEFKFLDDVAQELTELYTFDVLNVFSIVYQSMFSEYGKKSSFVTVTNRHTKLITNNAVEL